MDDLTAFLNARLDEDEAAAKAAAGPDWFLDSSEDCDERSIRYTGPSTLHPGLSADYSIADRVDVNDAEHAARHDPARVLRDAEAKRQVLTRYEFARNQVAVHAVNGNSAESEAWDKIAGGLESDVRSLAAIWIDHPDYRPEWKP